MKKKLIFIAEALWIGGIETALTNLLRALDYEKYDVTCLILRNETQLAPRLPKQCRLLVTDRGQAGYRFRWLHHLTEAPENPSRLHRAMLWLVPGLRWAENRLYIRYVRRQLRGQRFETAVIYSDAAAQTAVRAVRADKFLLYYHHGAMRKACHDEIAYRKSEKIIAVSHHQEAALRRFRPRYAHKMTAIHNLADIDGVLRSAQAFQPDFDPTQFHIVTCGRLHPDKGMDLAVEACAQLVPEHKNIHWWIIGGGPEEAALRRKIAELRLEKHMTLLGMQENPCPYIAAADLYVQPSRVEGYPMSILEARILGKSVLSTDNPGAREILRENGMLCEISPQGIAEGVKYYLREKPQSPQLDIAAENRAAMEKLETLL